MEVCGILVRYHKYHQISVTLNTIFGREILLYIVKLMTNLTTFGNRTAPSPLGNSPYRREDALHAVRCVSRGIQKSPALENCRIFSKMAEMWARYIQCIM